MGDMRPLWLPLGQAPAGIPDIWAGCECVGGSNLILQTALPVLLPEDFIRGNFPLVLLRL